jgi:gluconokinase
MIADALGQPLTLSRESEASSRGAALLALDSLGIPPGLALARAPDGERVEPDPTRRERYAEATARHSRLYDALVGPTRARRLSAWRG